MRYLLPVFVLLLTGCSASGPLSWFRRTPVVYHSPSCSQCSPSTAVPIGSAVPDSMVLEGATVDHGIYYDDMLDEGGIESRLDPPMSLPSTDGSAPNAESIPTPTPDPEA